MSKKIEFHTLKISDVTQETDDAVSIAFEIPADLTDKYAYTPGQYLTLRTDVNGEDLRRPYSICSGLNENEIRVCVKKVVNGRFSSFANDHLKTGDMIDVMTPMGQFNIKTNTKASNHYVGLAGGSGITPILSILKTTLSTDENAHFTLFYGNRNTSSIIFRKVFSDLKNQYMHRLNICHILSDEEADSDILSGLMDSEKSESLITKFSDPLKVGHFYICGPAPMMDGAEAALKRLNVADENVSIEKFTAAKDASPKTAGSSTQAEHAKDDAFVAEVTIIADGEKRVVKMSSDDSVLDVGTNALMDLPFACKSGICCTCRAKLVEGKVSMAVTTGLEDYEIEDGYILTCQAKPLTDKLVVDYDIV